MKRAAAINASLIGSWRRTYGIALTPAGAGVASLLFPGLFIASLARHRVLVAIGVGAGLALLANVAMAAFAAKRLRVTLAGPDLVQAGDRVALDVGLAAPPGLDGITCEVMLGGGEWIPAETSAAGSIAIRFPARAVVEQVTLSTRTSAPFGLVTLTHTSAARLRAPIVVAPAPVATPVAADVLGDAQGRWSAGADAGGLRRYQPGDLKRDVHWPSVARSRMLLVRDRQSPAGQQLTALWLRPSDPAAVEAVVGRARSVGDQLLAAGHRIRLGDSPVIVSRNQLARLLAALEVRVEQHGDAVDRAETSPIAGAELVVDEKGVRWLVSV